MFLLSYILPSRFFWGVISNISNTSASVPSVDLNTMAKKLMKAKGRRTKISGSKLQMIYQKVFPDNFETKYIISELVRKFLSLVSNKVKSISIK